MEKRYAFFNVKLKAGMGWGRRVGVMRVLIKLGSGPHAGGGLNMPHIDS